MNSTTNNNIKHTKDQWAAGIMHIIHKVCVRLNWFAEINIRNDNRWPPAIEIAVCVLVPSTIISREGTRETVGS